MRGRLYDLGDYPGMLPSTAEGDWVCGELYELREPILRELDRYEGRKFRRRLCIAVTDSGATVKAWVYEYTGRVSSESRIMSGDYSKRSFIGVRS